MPQSLALVIVHAIFSTKDRERLQIRRQIRRGVRLGLTGTGFQPFALLGAGYLGLRNFSSSTKNRCAPGWDGGAPSALSGGYGFGVNPSTLCRNAVYKNAKQTYLQPFLTSGRRGIQEIEASKKNLIP